MRVLVLGGDGFCGWPTALHLSARGWDVLVVDNLSRRNIDNELEVQSLTPIRSMGERIAAWQEVSGKTIDFVNMTVGKEFDRLVALINDWKPDSVVHFAEQRAAPYSMKSAQHKRYTVNKVADNTYLIRYELTSRPAANVAPIVKTYAMTITLANVGHRTRDDVFRNPAGLAAMNFSISEDNK